MDYRDKYSGDRRFWNLMGKAYIKQIAYYVPENVEENPKNRLTKKTGILSRYICLDDEIASDLAIKACEKLFAKGVDKTKVEYLLYCTQSPDYFLPTTACVLQDRLGLPETCGALDYNLGCSGYIYGLSLAKGLIESGQVKNVLLVTSETYSKYINEEDNTVKPLFGDGASATFIEGVNTDKEGISGFVFGTRGSGYDKLIVPVGGMKHRFGTLVEQYEDDFGSKRTNMDLNMDGAAITGFAMDVVPKTVEQVLQKIGLQKHEIDYCVFHQANKFMLDYLQQSCGLMDVPYWNDVSNYGNTVSSSIPIALCDLLITNQLHSLNKVLLCGFGVGLSWGGCVVDLGRKS